MGLFEKIFGNYSEKEVKRIRPIVDKINGLEEEISKLTASIARRRNLLSNENYVNKAPANIVEMDRKKLAEEEEKLEYLKNQI